MRSFWIGFALFVVLVLLGVWNASPNGSPDGRYHSCGFVTADGVTEHLADYWQRCGSK